MITARGWWFLLAVLVLLAVGVCAGLPALALVTLTLLIWFLSALLRFHFRLRLLNGKLRIGREIRDERGPVESLWDQRTFLVQAELHNESLLPTLYLRLTDRLPFGVKRVAGGLETDGVVRGQGKLAVSYHIHCEAPGQARFEGLQVQFADVQGFFYARQFLRAPRTYRVLPALADIRGHVPTVKRLNLLPLLGSHRHRRPGSGSELLDLRDYMPGDPPKTIAWKVSARRDRLITKVFESEVPLRCTFFVDTSYSVRVGSIGHNALSQLVELAAALCQAAAGSRDLPGLCLFDDEGVRTYLRPARSARHVVQIMNRLAEAAILSPTSGEVTVDALLPLAYSFAEEVYPDLLARELNHCPWWLPWWAPRAPATIPVVPLRARSWSAWPGVLWRRFWRRCWLVWGQRFGARLSGYERRRYRWRKLLAAVLAVRHSLGPGGLSYLMENDQPFVMHMQQFLAEHQVPYMPPLFGLRGEYLYAARGKVDVLARTLLQAIARGKDNELYVLLVDVLELENDLAPLVHAIKVGMARHHQIMVVCPWPPGIAPPDEKHLHQLEDRLADGRARNMVELRSFLEQLTTLRLQRAYFKLRRTFGKVGVTVLCATQSDSTQLVLNRLDQLRRQGRGVR
jgi:uncharacterized protein (DUF58 family)